MDANKRVPNEVTLEDIALGICIIRVHSRFFFLAFMKRLGYLPSVPFKAAPQTQRLVQANHTITPKLAELTSDV